MNEIEIYKARKIKDLHENDGFSSEGFLIKNISNHCYVARQKGISDYLISYCLTNKEMKDYIQTLEKIYPLPEHEKQEHKTLKDIIGGTKIKIEVE